MKPNQQAYEALLGSIAGQDQEAMRQFCELSHHSIATYIRKFVRDPWDAEEVVQDVYRQVWLNAANYSAERGTPTAWLYNLARSRAIDLLRNRRKTRRIEHEEPLNEGMLPHNQTTGETVRFEVGLVRMAMPKLMAEQRELLQLAFGEGYTHLEIAEMLALPLGTVKSRIRAGVRRLRQLLEIDLNGVEASEVSERNAA